MDKELSNEKSKVIFYYFRHRIYSFYKTASDDHKAKLILDKVTKQGKILSKVNTKQLKASNFARGSILPKKNQSNKENLIIINKSPPKNLIKKASLIDKRNSNIQIIKDSSAKKFIIIGGTYQALRDGLAKRGYIEEKDPESLNFEFKFVLFTKTANYDNLFSYQSINHFRKNTAVSRKVELMRNIRSLIYRGIDIDSFFPRCYDLGERVDFEDFLDDYKLSKAISILKSFLFQSNKFDINKEQHEISNLQQLIVSYNVMFERVLLLSNIINENSHNDCLLVGKSLSSIHDDDWNIIAQDEDLTIYKKELDRLKKMGKLTGSYGNINKLCNKNYLKIKHDNNKLSSSYLKDMIYSIKSLLDNVLLYYPQAKMSGHENIWIMKPSGLSRGRGIECIKSLGPALKCMKNQAQFIVQKYIENPLLLKQRKFDIRQWILVTSISPLEIWKFEEFYLRFSAFDYSTEDISNVFIHLTNNSITKLSENKEKEEEMKFKGNMCSRDEFINYLKNQYKKDIYHDILEEKINTILRLTIDSAKDQIEHRDNSYEIFGFDLMVDENFNVWLIEVNSSPAMDYSTEITENVVKQGLEDLLKVVIDRKKGDKNELVDTGKFKLIHNGEDLRSSNIPNKSLVLI